MLDTIKAREWSISGKGHAETIRFLGRFYEEHKNVASVMGDELQQLRNDLPLIVKAAQRDGLRAFLSNLVRIPEIKEDEN